MKRVRLTIEDFQQKNIKKVLTNDLVMWYTDSTSSEVIFLCLFLREAKLFRNTGRCRQ